MSLPTNTEFPDIYGLLTYIVNLLLYPKRKTRSFMKKSTLSSLVLLKNLSKIKSSTGYSTCIKLKYYTSSFHSVVGGCGNLYKRLSNSKTNLFGSNINNREWWKRNGCSGLYFYTYTRSEIEVVFFISSKRKLNELELRSRITKIMKPREMVVKFDDPEEFVNYFNEHSIVESGFQYFGISNQVGETNVSPTHSISTFKLPVMAS